MIFIEQLKTEFIPRIEEILEKECSHRYKLLEVSDRIGYKPFLYNAIKRSNKIIEHLSERVEEYRDYVKEYELIREELK